MWAVIAIAVATIGGTTWFMTSPLSRGWRPSGHPKRFLPGRALRSSGLRVVSASIGFLGIYIGACQVGLAAIGIQLEGAALAGVMVAVWSVGSLIGGLAYGLAAWRSPVNARYGVLLAALGACTAPLLLARSVALAVPLALVAGSALAPALRVRTR